LEVAGLSVPAKPLEPVFGCVLLRGPKGGGGIRVAAADFVTATTATLRNGMAWGSIVVDRAALRNALKAAAEGRSDEELAQLVVQLRAERPGETLLQLGDAPGVPLASYRVDDYPAVRGEQEPLAVVDGAAFAEAVAGVAMAASKDSGLPQLGGIQLAAEGAGFQLTAADNPRVASAWVAAEFAAPGRFVRPATIDAPTLKRLAKLLGDGPVRIGWAEARDEPGVAAALSFSWPHGTFFTRVARGLPEWAALVAPDEAAVRVGAKALVRAVLNVAGAGKGATVDLVFDGSGVVVCAGTGCAGRSARKTVGGTSESVPSGLRARFSATRLRESLRAFGVGAVKLRPGGPARRMTIHRADEEPRTGSGLVHTLMPTKVGRGGES
jgi:hypothetical protein